MRIIITGSKGQLRSDCMQVLGQENEAIALGRIDLDITRRTQVNAVMDRVRPDVIVNCAAHTGVDACEQE